MDEALKTHKETTFGWVLALQELVARRHAGLVRRAQAQAVEARRAAPRRYLAPR